MSSADRGKKMSEELKFTAEEASVYLGVSERTMENWRAAGKGPKFYKPTEKLVYYFITDLNEWIKKKKS